MNKDTLARIGVVVAIVIAITACFLPVLPDGQSLFAGVTTGTAFPHGVSVGLPANSPTNFAKLMGSGTCALIGTNSSQAASTTVAYDCALTGIQVGDIVFAQLSSTTPASGGSTGWDIVSANASTTAGFATVLLANLSGGARVPSATSVGSTTKLWVFRTQ